MRPTATKIFLSLIFVGTLSCFCPVAYGADLTILDTSGFTRAAESVDGLGNVEFSVIGSDGVVTEGASITLSNAATGETLTAVVSNGVAAFESIAPGTWTVASATTGVTFTNVAVSSVALAAGAGGGIALGAAGLAAAAGGTAAIVAATDTGNSSDLSPST